MARPPFRSASRQSREALAYAEVERVTRARAKNFAYGIRLLPKPKRRAIAAIYAFAREVDDVADGELSLPEKRAALEALRSAVDDPRDDDPMQVALADAMRRFPVPPSSLHTLIDGGLQDTEQTRYETFDDLAVYCKRVAGAVGVACTAVYGADEPELAETLGIALQLINILRDVREDWELDRVYLPQDELAEFGVAEEDIAAGALTDEWRGLAAFQAQRARAYLAEGLALLDHLDRRSAACVSAFAGLYAATLDRIEESGYDVFAGKPHLSAARKLAIVGGSVLSPSRVAAGDATPDGAVRRSTGPEGIAAPAATADGEARLSRAGADGGQGGER